MQTNTERTRNYRAAARQSGKTRQINLWLPVEAVEHLDRLARQAGCARAAVVARLLNPPERQS